MVKSSRVVKAVNVNVTQESLKKIINYRNKRCIHIHMHIQFPKKIMHNTQYCFWKYPKKIAFALMVTFQTDKGGNWFTGLQINIIFIQLSVHGFHMYNYEDPVHLHLIQARTDIKKLGLRVTGWLKIIYLCVQNLKWKLESTLPSWDENFNHENCYMKNASLSPLYQCWFATKTGLLNHGPSRQHWVRGGGRERFSAMFSVLALHVHK